MTEEIMKAFESLNGEIYAVWFLIGAALVFWMQAGFAMVEAGFTRAKNTGNIIMKNLMDFCIGTVMFILIGFSLLLGEDLVGFIGGPPCPDFSIAGKQAGAKGKHGRLSQVYIDIICEQNPDFFVFENVKGLLSTTKHRAFFNKILQTVHKSGYATTYRLINALEYGAAQDRERVILIGIKLPLCADHVDGKTGTIKDFPWEQFLEYSKEDIQKAQWPTADVFQEDAARKKPKGVIEPLTIQYWFEKNDVENHPNAEDYFVPRAGLKKMQTYAEGDDSKKCYKRPHRWRYAPTAAYGNNEVHLHPYKARRMSVAETLAIQSLPKNFELPEDIPLSAKFKTIGNGVPYLAAKGVAKTLKKYLEEL